MSIRLPCKNPECSNTILEETAKATGGLCMPCVGVAKKKERDEFIRHNRKDVNAFQGISDPVEILKIIHAPRKHDPLINWIPCPVPVDQLYLQLSSDDVHRLEAYAITLSGTDQNEQAEDIAKSLVGLRGAHIDLLLKSFIDNDTYRPALAFYGASPAIRDSLIDRVNRTPRTGNQTLPLNHLLLALAWIGDAEVLTLFSHWKQHSPPWSEFLYIPPERYAESAGWELSESGQRRDLYFQECWALAKGTSNQKEDFVAVSERDDACPWCSSRLINLISFRPQFSAHSQPEPIRVLTCEICTAFGTILGQVNENGAAQWSPANSKPRYLPDDAESWGRFPKDCLRLAAARNPLFAADQFLPVSVSQLGGHPTWVQDAAYPKCPTCSRTMKFVAQIARDEIEDHSEGTYYSFVCDSCKTTATTYQQT
jgi:hypothetical protein